MSKNKGFLMIDRQAFSSDYWREPRRFSKFEAWVDILQRAWYADASKLPARKGEVTIVQRKTAARWGWARKTVVRFIAELVENGQLKRTPNPSVYAIGEPMGAKNVTKKEAKKEAAKTTDNQRDNANEYTNKGTTKDTNMCPTYIDNNIINKKRQEKARATATESAPPALPTETATDGTPLPFGVKRADWDKFAKWSEENLPTLRPRITPVVYWKLRNLSLNDTKQMATILVEMEQGGRKIHVIENEYDRRLREWKEDCR